MGEHEADDDDDDDGRWRYPLSSLLDMFFSKFHSSTGFSIAY